MYRWCSKCNEKRRDADTICPVCQYRTDLELDINDTLRIDSKREFVVTRQLSHYTDAGMSAVYLAGRKDKPDMYGALKVAKPASIEALKREAECLQHLKHDHIIRLVHPEQALWQDRKGEMTLHFFALEYMDGGSLKDRLKQKQKLPLDEAVRITLAIGRALSYAHQAGFVHLDVKPANVLFSANGRVVLSDFGIARAEVQATELRKRVGTLFYNSPEQVADPPVHTHKADIYALGIMLYEMLVGVDRFRKHRTSSSSKEDSRSPAGARAISKPLPAPENNLPPPRKLESRIPRAVERVILKAIAPNPADRYDTVDIMLDNLIMAVSRPSGQKNLLLALAGAGILVALVLMALGLYFWPKSQPPVAVVSTPTLTATAPPEQPTPAAGMMVIVSTRTPTPTPTSVNQSSSSLPQIPTVTRVPIDTPTPPPAVRPGAVSINGVIELIAPDDDIQVGNTVEFKWRWKDKGCSQPPAGYAFEIRVWRDNNIASPQGAMDAGAEKQNMKCDQNTGIYSFTIGRLKSVPGFENSQEGRFRWDVALVKLSPYTPVITPPHRTFFVSS